MLYNGVAPQGNPYPPGTTSSGRVFAPGVAPFIAAVPCRSLDEEETCYQIR